MPIDGAVNKDHSTDIATRKRMNEMRNPKVYQLPLSHLGSHETIVVVQDGIAVSHDTWNYSTDENGNRTFMTSNVNVQLFFPSDSVVSVIRA